MSKWCFPVLNGAGKKKHTYTVQDGLGFLAPAYFAARKMHHTGADFNATTGGDSDLGDPIFCVADGEVVEVGVFRGWGYGVLIYHPSANVWSQYAHMDEINSRLRKGAKFSCGEQLGTIGKGANGSFLAHLHFEVRKFRLPANEWPSSHMSPDEAMAYILANYSDPLKFLAKVKAVKSWAEVKMIKAEILQGLKEA